ncbi:MAG: PTS sugar transporter subunit IIA [Myxococcales bacterium]|nr:PTS sugar transporter subunit IIA [Myxococcales bacterium]
MRLSELLSEERVTVRLAAPTKEVALDAMASLLAQGQERLEVGLPAIVRVLRDREALASTGVGDEVAIPHGRLPGLPRLVAALALCPEGVDFDSIDRRPVRLFVAILAPERCPGDQLRALARVSKLLRDGRVRDRLHHAASAAEVLDIVREEEALLG